jgi:hypothetical protein
MILWALRHNNQMYLEGYPLTAAMRRDGVRPIPVDLWHWGIVNCGGLPRQLPAELVMLRLLPQAKAMITQEGLIFDKMSYVADSAIPNNLYIEAALQGAQEITVSYHPRKPHVIYAHFPRERQFIRFVLNLEKEEGWSGFLREDILVSQAVKRQVTAAYQDAKVQHDVDWGYLGKRFTDKAVQQQKMAEEQGCPLLSKERLDIDTNRGREQAMHDLQDKLSSAALPEPPEPEKKSVQQDEDCPDADAAFMEILKSNPVRKE